jgi:hypothetical protein
VLKSNETKEEIISRNLASVELIGTRTARRAEIGKPENSPRSTKLRETINKGT